MSDMDFVDQILQQWGRERPDLDCSPMGIVGRISQLQREVYLAQRATFARYGLDAPSFDVLAALRRAGPPYQLTPSAHHAVGVSWYGGPARRRAASTSKDGASSPYRANVARWAR